ncbi:MAG: tetratricopeptide repeat protein, partial [Alphaproteobacteria bacterium]|nr:tetratricopeptide repeat protein [Alphaproteobacteria bacterium]
MQRLKFLQKLVRLNTLKRQQKSEIPVLFSSEILKQACRILFRKHGLESRAALLFLVIGKPQKAATLLNILYPQISLLLLAHIDARAAYKKILKNKKLFTNSAKYGVYLPMMALLLYDFKTFSTALSKLAAEKIKPNCRGYYNWLSGFAYLNEGDMLSASQKASEALKFFQRKKYAAEAAGCYLLLADIYRVSCVNDVAETMLNAALELYKQQKLPLATAQTIVLKGMLMLFENRPEEAADKYEQALKLPITGQLTADIYNQQALLLLAQNKAVKARKVAEKALLLQQKSENKYAEALSLQLLSQIVFKQEHYRLAVKYAETAEKIYESR